MALSLALKKVIKNLEKQLPCANLSSILLLAVTPSATSSEYQKHVLFKVW